MIDLRDRRIKIDIRGNDDEVLGRLLLLAALGCRAAQIRFRGTVGTLSEVEGDSDGASV